MILGVDPGNSGALALYSYRVGSVRTFAMPLERVKRGRETKESIDGPRLVNLCAHLVGLGVLYAVVEKVGGAPRQSAPRAFNFGYGAGILYAGLLAAGLPKERIIFVAPAVWKRHFGLGADKSAARALASRLFPAAAGQWSLGKHDGHAESALLAKFGYRKLIKGALVSANR